MEDLLQVINNITRYLKEIYVYFYYYLRFQAVLQYRVTIAAIPLIPLMDKYVVPLILKFNKDANSKIDKGTGVKVTS